MITDTLTIGDPFFTIRVVRATRNCTLAPPTMILNLASTPLAIRTQRLGPLQSTILHETSLPWIAHAVTVEGFAAHPDTDTLLACIRSTWPTAHAVRGEERLATVAHYMSPKAWVGSIGLTLYHAASVPLGVGLHREHPFCPGPGMREVHMQIIGIGKMQQCTANDIATLYLEETMAPGCTHRPLYDANGNYPWHQYETITPSVFLAVEILPEGAAPPPP